MATVTRYFSTSSAGAGDGTTWANRAQLESGGAVSSIIRQHDHAADTLVAYIGPGSYSAGSTSWSGAFWSVAAPTQVRPLILRACDSSGNPWTPPNPAWVAAQPVWDTTGMPVIDHETRMVSGVIVAVGVRMTTAYNGNAFNFLSAEWCELVNTASHAGAQVYLGSARCSVFRVTGTTFDKVVGLSQVRVLINCRIEGNPDATSGDRRGTEQVSYETGTIDQCAIIGCPGEGWYSAATIVGQFGTLSRLLVAYCGHGIVGAATADQNVAHKIDRCVVVGCGGYGINGDASVFLVTRCRVRNNTSGNIVNLGDLPTDLDNITSAGTDADEFVDASNGDYRIRYGSALWGKGIGAGDEPPQRRRVFIG